MQERGEKACVQITPGGNFYSAFYRSFKTLQVFQLSTAFSPLLSKAFLTANTYFHLNLIGPSFLILIRYRRTEALFSGSLGALGRLGGFNAGRSHWTCRRRSSHGPGVKRKFPLTSNIPSGAGYLTQTQETKYHPRNIRKRAGDSLPR